MTLLVGPGAVVAAWERPGLAADAGVEIEGDRVVRVAPFAQLLAQRPAAERLDARGALVVPGFVNLHHHLYAAAAKGLDPGPGVDDFYEVLRRLWWRLDRALDAESIRVAALLSLADALRAGVTTLFDHHSSPSCPAGSLDAVAGAVEEAGLSAVLSLEVSDRNGREAARAALEENARFFRAARGRLRGILGLHAAFTLGDETLREAARLAAAGMGCHVHCAEARIDDALSRRLGSAGAFERLDGAGLVGPRTLLAHGVHLTPAALERAAEGGATIAHAPESNMHNGVGRLDPAGAIATGVSVGLGTDGLGSSVLGALRAALLSLRDLHHDPEEGLSLLLPLLAANARTAARHMDEPLFGTLLPGAPADLAVLAEPVVVPATAGSLPALLVHGSGGVRHTVAGGRVLMSDFEIRAFDTAALAEDARRVLASLRERFETLDPIPERGELVAALANPVPVMEDFA